MALAGAFLRFTLTALRIIQFLAAGLILGTFSYFLAVISGQNSLVSTRTKVVEGISGLACVYTAFAILLTCCLGGKKFFAFLAMVFDACFVAGFIVIAVLTKNGASSCTGFVNTPLGNGDSNSRNGSVTLGTACRLQTVSFAVALVAAFLFIITLFVQLSLGRREAKDKRYGPSPSNNYTSGSRFHWGQKRRGTMDPEASGRPQPLTTYRTSTDAASSVEAKDVYNQYGHNATVPNAGINGGYGAAGYDRTSYHPHPTATTANF